jgi:hypothetical protein
MRPLRLLALLLPATTILAFGTPAMAVAASIQAPGGASAAAERAHLAFERRMVARRTTHVVVAARPLANGSAAGGFDTITGVGQVSRDTLGRSSAPSRTPRPSRTSRSIPTIPM